MQGQGSSKTPLVNQVQKCDGTRTSLSKLSDDFDYSRFDEYLRWKSIYNPSGVNLFDEKTVKAELSSIYGELDENSTEYSWILKKYRANRALVLKEQENEQEEGQPKAPEFTKEEINYFEKICKGHATIEPFLLPRLRPSSENRDPILNKIRTLINQTPTGISLPQFIIKFGKMYQGQKFTPELLSLAQRNSIIFIQTFESKIKILFPHSFKEFLSTPEEILSKINHTLQVLLRLDFGGRAPIPDLLEAHSNFFKDFSIENFIEDWGFQSVNQFAEILMKIHGKLRPRRRTLQLLKSTAKEDVGKLFLEYSPAEGGDDDEEEDVRRGAPKWVKDPSALIVPPHFLSPEDSIRSLTDDVEAVVGLNRNVKAYVTAFNSPTDFNVILQFHKKDLEELQKELQDDYISEISEMPRINSDADLPIGMCLASIHKGIVYRVQYLKRIAGELHQVKRVDFGVVEQVRSGNLYFLHERYAKLKGQAIPCALHNVNSSPAGGEGGWDHETIEFATEIMFRFGKTEPFSNLVTISFITFDCETIWKVKGSDEENRVTDFGSNIMLYARKRFESGLMGPLIKPNQNEKSVKSVSFEKKQVKGNSKQESSPSVKAPKNKKTFSGSQQQQPQLYEQNFPGLGGGPQNSQTPSKGSNNDPSKKNLSQVVTTTSKKTKSGGGGGGGRKERNFLADDDFPAL